jgi:hypothetical protein
LIDRTRSALQFEIGFIKSKYVIVKKIEVIDVDW